VTRTARAPGRIADEAAAVLWKSEGFLVEGPDGPFGIVEDAIRIPGLKRPAALAVCLCEDERRVVLVPITDIVEVDTDARRIVVRELPHYQR
jgi:hypothetical protein